MLHTFNGRFQMRCNRWIGQKPVECLQFAVGGGSAGDSGRSARAAPAGARPARPKVESENLPLGATLTTHHPLSMVIMIGAGMSDHEKLSESLPREILKRCHLSLKF